MALEQSPVWPFPDPPNAAAFTFRRIMEDGRPVRLVCHDSEDGGWQFLDGEIVSVKDGILVCLEHMVKRDPTLAELADLPPGWEAERKDPGKPWKRAKSPDPDE